MVQRNTPGFAVKDLKSLAGTQSATASPRLPLDDLLREIKSDPDLCSIPVIVMSTSVDDEDVRVSYREHANAFVSKAPDFDQLVETFEAIGAFWLSISRLPTR